MSGEWKRRIINNKTKKQIEIQQEFQKILLIRWQIELDILAKTFWMPLKEVERLVEDLEANDWIDTRITTKSRVEFNNEMIKRIQDELANRLNSNNIKNMYVSDLQNLMDSLEVQNKQLSKEYNKWVKTDEQQTAQELYDNLNKIEQWI